MIKSPQTIFTGVPRGGGAEVCIDGIPFEYIVIATGNITEMQKKPWRVASFALSELVIDSMKINTVSRAFAKRRGAQIRLEPRGILAEESGFSFEFGGDHTPLLLSCYTTLLANYKKRVKLDRP